MRNTQSAPVVASPRETIAEDSASGAALFQAITDESIIRINRAIDAGADPFLLYPDPDHSDARVTAIWHSVRAVGGSHLMYLLGAGLTEVPVVYENAVEGAVGIFDALAALYRIDDEKFRLSWSQIQHCFDFSVPAVAHGAWDMAAKIMIPDDPAEPSAVSDFILCKRIIALGARPRDGAQSWERLMSRHITVQSTADAVVSMCTGMMTSADCLESTRRILEDGVDPNARVHGVPLLHHTGPCSVPEVAQVLLEAGADLDATCTREQFLEVFSSRLKAVEPDALSTMGEAVTATDVARLLGNVDQVKIFEVRRAKSAIDSVLKGATARAHP